MYQHAVAQAPPFLKSRTCMDDDTYTQKTGLGILMKGDQTYSDILLLKRTHTTANKPKKRSINITKKQFYKTCQPSCAIVSFCLFPSTLNTYLLTYEFLKAGQFTINPYALSACLSLPYLKQSSHQPGRAS